jgi:hypothetical protein
VPQLSRSKYNLNGLDLSYTRVRFSFLVVVTILRKAAPVSTLVPPERSRPWLYDSADLSPVSAPVSALVPAERSRPKLRDSVYLYSLS